MISRSRTFGAIGVFLLAVACFGSAQNMSTNPISKANLLDALESMQSHKIKRHNAGWWVDRISHHKVDFEVTPEVEAEIRQHGKYLRKKGLDELIATIRGSYAFDSEYKSESETKESQKPEFPIEQITTTSDAVPSHRPDLPFGLRVTIQSTVTITDAHFIMECDGAIGRGEVAQSGPSMTQVIIHHRMVSPNAWEFFLDQPPITPQKPLLVFLYSATKIKLVRVVKLK